MVYVKLKYFQYKAQCQRHEYLMYIHMFDKINRPLQPQSTHSLIRSLMKGDTHFVVNIAFTRCFESVKLENLKNI